MSAWDNPHGVQFTQNNTTTTTTRTTIINAG